MSKLPPKLPLPQGGSEIEPPKLPSYVVQALNAVKEDGIKEMAVAYVASAQFITMFGSENEQIKSLSGAIDGMYRQVRALKSEYQPGLLNLIDSIEQWLAPDRHAGKTCH